MSSGGALAGRGYAPNTRIENYGLRGSIRPATVGDSGTPVCCWDSIGGSGRFQRAAFGSPLDGETHDLDVATVFVLVRFEFHQLREELFPSHTGSMNGAPVRV